MTDPRLRFSNRVENYIRYRPGYPKEVISFLQTVCGLRPESVIADIGSGTGILAELFLANGNRVFGIEPNREMREAGERLLAVYPSFTSVDASAEATTLPGQCVDFITAGQAFHWFDRARCRDEFRRILRPGGWVVLIWNDRQTDTTTFLKEYEQLLIKYGTDYQKVNHKHIDGAVLSRFFPAEPAKKVFPNQQHCNFASLKGRVLSSSYVPEAGQPRYDEMLAALKNLFERRQQRGRVTLEYDTAVYYGQLQ